MTGEIIAAVLWILSIPAGSALLSITAVAVGALFTDMNRDRVWPAGAGLVSGWVLGIAWSVFALVQAILHIVAAVQLA